MEELTERERNRILFNLLIKLKNENDIESIELLKTMVAKDTPSMQKSFEIIVNTK